MRAGGFHSQTDAAAGASALPDLGALLARWGLPLPLLQTPAAEQLGRWLDWRDAVALAQALRAPAESPPTLTPAQAAAQGNVALGRGVRALQAGMAERRLLGIEPPDAALSLADAAAPYRLHHAQQQRLMTERLAALRGQLRGLLQACGEPALARLAALDAVFERALGAQEQQRLAALPSMLLRRAAVLRTQWPDTWPAVLWAELQQLLQAELRLRLQPLWGLLEALQPDVLETTA